MTLEPLLSAPLAIQLHVATVLPAAVIGAYILARPKGTALHRLFGRVWIGLMVVTALSSFFIHTIRLIGPFSPIHALSVFTLIGAFQAVQAARRGDIRAHRRAVLGIYGAGIGLAGLFTLLPGRLMHAVVLTGSPVSGLVAIVLFLALIALPLKRAVAPLKIG